MFGILRFLLAYLVVVSHLGGAEYYGHLGFYAVRGFFVMSGYIMTAALNDVYRFDGVRFWTNRALRLLPPFYLVGALTLVAVMLAPHEANLFQKFWRPAMSAHDVLLNLAVLPLQLPHPSFRMVPQFWSIALEVEMYFLLWCIVARHAGAAWVALGTGLTYQLMCSYADLGVGALYFTAPSAVLPFAAGALVYFARQNKLFAVSLPLAAAAFAAWFANMLAGGWLLPSSYIFGLGYYVDTVLFTIVVAGLAQRKFNPLIQRADRALGEWAYFIFLVQWLAAFLVATLVMGGQWRGWALILAATPAIVAAGAALAVLNQKLIEPFRNRVRPSLGRASAPAEWRKWLRALGIDDKPLAPGEIVGGLSAPAVTASTDERTAPSCLPTLPV